MTRVADESANDARLAQGSLHDHDLLLRIDERVVALRTDVLAIQVQLVKLEMTLVGVRIAAARAAGAYGAISGVVAAALTTLITGWLR